MHYWIGDVLGRVSADCARRGEPLLSALCVNTEGSVGEGYRGAVIDIRGELVGDVDDHAASERLACYRYFGAELPDDGGRPQLTPRIRASRTTARKVAAAASPRPTCPTCHLQLPATGVCDNCD